MTRLQENTQILRELLIGCFAHYGFTETTLKIEINLMLDRLCKQGKLQRDQNGCHIVGT